MTTTTTRPASRQQPWPSRREREGGRRAVHEPEALDAAAVTRLPGLAERAPQAGPHRRPRHAAHEPAATELLPLIPGQRAASDVALPPATLPPTTVRPAPTDPPRPVTPPVRVAAPVRVAPVRVAPVVPPVPTSIPAGPAATPYPPRPVVGSGVRRVPDASYAHRTDGRIRHPRNGLGVAALCLGLLGIPLGLVPVTGFLATGLGVLAVAFGIAGWSRTRSRTATNAGSAVTGVVVGLLALALGVLGTVTFVQDPSQIVYDVNRVTSAFSTIGE